MKQLLGRWRSLVLMGGTPMRLTSWLKPTLKSSQEGTARFSWSQLKQASIGATTRTAERRAFPGTALTSWIERAVEAC